MKSFVKIFGSLACLAPMVVGAQQPAPAAGSQCDPPQDQPQFVARSWFSLSRAIVAINSNADPKRDLMDAVRQLTDPRAKDRDKNVAGQNFTLGQAYILLLGQGTSEVVRRGDIGIQTNPDQAIDLVLAADTVFDAAEAALPECTLVIAQWRQQKPWLDIVNHAITAVNADQPDTAEALARRALILDTRAPYAYTVLAMVARTRKDDSLALRFYRQALEAAGSDTIYTDVRTKTLGDIARMLAERAELAPPAQRRALAREAIAAYEAFLAEPEIEDLVRGYGIGQLASLYAAAGDSARMKTAYATVLADPSKFGERTLLEAGMVATRAGASRDAVKLFGAVATANPYQRDALNNLAASYIGAEEFDKVFPLVGRLIEIDPNNPDNYLLYAYAYGGLLKNARTAALRRAYTDSLVKYNTLSESMPVKVTFTEFSRLAAETRLSGAIQNRGRATKSYTLILELLGPNGAAIASQNVTVGPVTAGARQEFRVVLPTPGAQVAGFRYRPVS